VRAPQHRGRREVGNPDEPHLELGAHLPQADAGDDHAEQAHADRVPARPEVAGYEREEREAVHAGHAVEQLLERPTAEQCLHQVHHEPERKHDRGNGTTFADELHVFHYSAARASGYFGLAADIHHFGGFTAKLFWT